MVATWSELCADKQLRDLPYRIETNRQGQVIMTPHKPIHSHQPLINRLLDECMSAGVTLVECAINRAQVGVRNEPQRFGVRVMLGFLRHPNELE